MEYLTIGQLAKRLLVNVETIRYYERRGLIPDPQRRESGYRQFSQDMVKRIRFIKHAQQVGFTLEEISELPSLRVDPDTTCADIKKRAEIKIGEIEKKMQALKRMKLALAKLKAACRGRGPLGDCPILEALESSGES
jgi:MerR family mercuric resistance operon transcriptional regulator